jgi:endogenous inhibitor of DNA gyrase (YacG/DUF329 family)
MCETELKCPHCGCDLESDACYDRGCEGDYCYISMEGFCPECNRQFRWDEIYDFTGFQNLREMTE